MADTASLASSMYAMADWIDAYLASTAPAKREEEENALADEVARLTIGLQLAKDAEAETRAQLTFAQDTIARLKRSGRSTRTSAETTRSRSARNTQK